MVLSKQWITKALIRLRGCAVWSAPLLFANLRRQVFSRRGPKFYVLYLLLWNIYVISVLFCYAFVRARLLMHCGHLLGKGWPLGSRLWCLIVKLSLSHWYPGSGVVLDCIDSWSLLLFLLSSHYCKTLIVGSVFYLALSAVKAKIAKNMRPQNTVSNTDTLDTHP